MACSDCDFTNAAGQHFSVKKAVQQIDGYRRGKLGPTTRLLRDGLEHAGVIKGALLDIGAGVGTLTFELLQRGITSAVAVDASDAYLAAAKEEAARRQLSESISFIKDDFATSAAGLPNFDVVTLDRVVCCYADYKTILREAAKRARVALAISYPRPVWFVRLGNGWDNAVRRLRSNPFRTFIHPVADIQRMILDSGFEMKTRSQTVAWSAEIYTRRQT